MFDNQSLPTIPDELNRRVTSHKYNWNLVQPVNMRNTQEVKEELGNLEKRRDDFFNQFAQQQEIYIAKLKNFSYAVAPKEPDNAITQQSSFDMAAENDDGQILFNLDGSNDGSLSDDSVDCAA